MKINLFTTLLVVAICHNGSLAFGSPISSRVPDTIEELENITDNYYFQATKQIFYINEPIKNPDCTQHQEPKPTPNVPADYTVTPGIGAHKFHLNSQTWNDARNICIKEGAHLIILRSAEDEAIIKKIQLDKQITEVWLGLQHDQFNTNEWVTVLDEPLEQVGFAPWQKKEPNHVAKNEHCVEYSTRSINDLGINDVKCEEKRPFFCKIDLQ